MATAKKAAKKTAAKKAATKAAATKTAVKTPAPKETAKAGAAKTDRTVLSKQEALAAKEAAMADAPEVKTTINPEGSWPFPTSERP